MIKLITLGLLFFTSSTNAQQTFNKLNANELVVTSTTKASKPCPAMTETQRNAIASPVNGFCIYNTTTSKLNVYNGTIWKAAGGGVDNWGTGTVYAVNDIVIESSKIYQCLIAHTSGTFATDLAASRWVEISSTVPVNLTGPITSVGNATSIASQTGTGSTFVVQNTPTLTTPNIGAATGTSLALAGNISAYNYDKDNLLINGNIENPLSSEWTCTVGTCTRTTVAGEFSKDTAALKVALSSQAMNVSQTVTTPSGIQKQGFARVIYRVPATMADFQICTLVDAAEQTCIPTANLIKDDTFRSAEIPLTFGSTSAGIKFKTTSTYTANAYFDGAILAQGLGTQSLQGNIVYSASVSSTGVVTNENVDWINGNYVVTSTSTYTATYNTGIFTQSMNCTATPQTQARAASVPTSSSTSNVVVIVNSTSNAAVADSFLIICQKTANDYLAASSSAYSAASSGVHYISAPAASSTFGSTNTSVPVFSITANNNAGFLTVNSNATDGTSFVATRDLIINISGVCSAGTGGTCHISKNATTLVSSGAPGAGTSLMSGVVQTQSSAGDVTIAGEFLITTGDVIRFQRNSTLGVTGIGPMVITARPATSVIVGSFQDVPTVPNAGARIDTFSVSYGTANATTVCSASPCTYVDQIGAAVSTVSRASAGNYNLNFPKTYIKMKCTAGLTIPGSANTPNPFTCANCNSLAFYSQVYNTGVSTDSYGTLHCFGSY